MNFINQNDKTELIKTIPETSDNYEDIVLFIRTSSSNKIKNTVLQRAFGSSVNMDVIDEMVNNVDSIEKGYSKYNSKLAEYNKNKEKIEKGNQEYLNKSEEYKKRNATT